MAMSDLTVEILKQIRDEIRTTNERIDVTRIELSSRLDRLERRQTETEVRLGSELVATVGAINGLRDVVVQAIAEGRQVMDHERRIVALEKKVG